MSKQRADAVLRFIRTYIREEEVSPSVREICEGCGIRSTSTVHRYLHRLEAEGRIRMASGKNRAIVVTEDAGDSTPQGIPLIGVVAAGQPITANQNITDYVEIVPSRQYDGELFALRVKGDSMINIGIFDGDIAIVEQTPVASNGDVVVAAIEGCDGGYEATVKTFYKENGHYRLQPENDEMDPIIVEKVSILGRVVSLIRYF